MRLIHTGELMGDAVAAGSDVAASSVVHLKTGVAFVAAALMTGLRESLHVSQQGVRHRGRFERVALATLSVTRASTSHAITERVASIDVELDVEVA